MFEKAIDEEDQRDHNRHELDHQPGVALHAAVEGGIDLLAGQAAGHLSEIGLHAGGDNHGRGRPALDAGAEEAHVRALDGGDARARVARVGLLDRHGFAGQRRLDEEQVFCRQEPHIAGDHVAGGEFDNVAGNELLERDFFGLAAPDHGSGDADHRFELGGCGVRLGFLDKAERYSQDHHQQHHRAGPEIPGGERERRQDDQQNHQRVAGRNIQALRPAFMLFAADLVGAILLHPRGGFFLSQSGGGSAEQSQYLGAVLARHVAGKIGLASIVWTG